VTEHALDPDYINRAAPPGSMRYFALLYASPEQRALLTAIFVVEAEIRASASAAHEVAHTRLQWWRAEIDRLINRNAQHPATKALQELLPAADFSIVHEALTAADMDLARMTYNTAAELTAYLRRSGGAILQLLGDAQNSAHVGAWIRRVETLRDLAADARAGRVYWALEELESHRVSLDDLRTGKSIDSLRLLIAQECERLRVELPKLSASRPLMVLAHLHTKLIDRIERANHDIFGRRHELGSLEKVWTAWRAARRH
jgi:phytoene synthase